MNIETLRRRVRRPALLALAAIVLAGAVAPPAVEAYHRGRRRRLSRRHCRRLVHRRCRQPVRNIIRGVLGVAALATVGVHVGSYARRRTCGTCRVPIWNPRPGWGPGSRIHQWGPSPYPQVAWPPMPTGYYPGSHRMPPVMPVAYPGRRGTIPRYHPTPMVPPRWHRPATRTSVNVNVGGPGWGGLRIY